MAVAALALLSGCRSAPPRGAQILRPSPQGSLGSTRPSRTPIQKSWSPTQGGYDDGAGYGYDPFAPDPNRPIRKWRQGELLVQGYIAANVIQSMSRSGGDYGDLEAGEDSISQYPAIGGGVQWKFAGDEVDFGLEGMLSIGGRANGGAFVIGGSGALIAISLDLLIVDFYGGPFIAVPLGRRARLYGSAGPLFQFTNYYQSSADADYSGSGSGFGLGAYARVGIELEASQSSYIGMGIRYSDTSVDLSNSLGDFDLETVEFMITYTIRG